MAKIKLHHYNENGGKDSKLAEPEQRCEKSLCLKDHEGEPRGKISRKNEC